MCSFCYTVAGDGSGADAVSGLGRGFVYSGTRALLVTHWPMESASARVLVTGLFDRQAADKTLSRAQALRQSMLALMQQKEGSFAYAHPLFWAPYALVGDGGGGEALLKKVSSPRSSAIEPLAPRTADTGQGRVQHEVTSGH